MLWNWLNCYFSGRHDYGITCASGSMFLRCIHCGKRSNGWDIHREQPALVRPLAFRPREVTRPQRPA